MRADEDSDEWTENDTARLRRRQKRQKLLEVQQRAEQIVERHNAKNKVNRQRNSWNQAKYHAQTISRNEPFFIRDLKSKINSRYNSLRQSFIEKYEPAISKNDGYPKTVTDLGSPVFNLSHKRRFGNVYQSLVAAASNHDQIDYEKLRDVNSISIIERLERSTKDMLYETQDPRKLH